MECGASLALICEHCAAQIAEGAHFCPNCGEPRVDAAALHPMPKADGEQRQLTVMFCDLVDSTELSRRLDTEELRTVIRAYQEVCAGVIESFDGEIAQYLGDGLLVYFGYPAAHDDDAARAVSAALRIFAALPELNARLHGLVPGLREYALKIRIAINTGPVIVGEMGGGAKQERLALGQTVNLAARLQSVAEPGWIVISAATRHLVAGSFVIEDLGAKRLKGVEDAIPTYRVLHASGSLSRLELAAAAGLTPLVGREQEIALLLDRWARVKDGAGEAVLLVGEPGIGKSRLDEATATSGQFKVRRFC